MSQFLVTPTTALRGIVQVPGDKSLSHRAVLLAAVADGVSVIDGCLLGADNRAMITALRQLNTNIIVEDATSRVTVEGRGLWGLSPASAPLNLQNSGTALRLLMGLLAGQRFASTLLGDASLSVRPMRRVADPLCQMGATIALSAAGTAPVQMKGHPLQAIDYTMPIPSAQVKSALLLAGLYASGETVVRESAVTRDHTERLLRAFGYPITVQASRISLSGGGVLRALELQVPGDLSSAAFFLVAATLVPGSELVLPGVGVNPTRLGVLTLLRAMGADIEAANERWLGEEPVADLTVRFAPLVGIEITPSAVALAIDELPVLMVAAACAKGETIIRGAAELRVKESDRLGAMARGLTRMGITCFETADGIIIQGGRLAGARIQSDADHRIAMAFAVAACVATGPVLIEDSQFVATSLPNFVTLAQRVGMRIHREESA